MDHQGPYPWLPDTSWPVLAPFWAALREGALTFPRCTECGRFQWYPQAMCPACRSMGFAWTEVRPVGTVFTYTVVRRAFLPGFVDRVPTTVALVAMDDAPSVRLVTNVFGVDGRDGAEQVSIGAAVAIEVVQVAPDVHLPFAVLR